MAHLDLGSEADVVAVAPATADLLSRMAGGRADDLAAAVLLAADAPVVACPAMNVRMWEHPATRRSVARLREHGVRIVGPNRGELAEGEFGPGRMAEPDEIEAELARALEGGSPLADRRVVVTGGPTRAWLDPVRFLANGSSGRMGAALAGAAWRRGAVTTLLAGPGTAPFPYGPRVREVETAEAMLEALREELEEADVLLMAAAPSDFRPPERREAKISKADGPLEFRLEQGPDLLVETADLRRSGDVFTLGFALETGDGRDSARRKLEEKELDLVALNEAGRPGVGMGSPTNEVTLLDREGGTEEMPLMSKEDLADRLLDRVVRGIGG